MNRVAWTVEKSGFQKNFEKFWLRKFSIQVILDTYLLYREGLPSEIAFQGKTSSPKSYIEG